MKNLEIQAGTSTPHILFNIQKMMFTIEGISKPENVRDFYYPVMDWLNDFHVKYAEPKEQSLMEKGLSVEIKLSYFNSSSAKFLFDILEKISEIKKLGIDTKVYWYFDESDEDHRDAGEELSDMLGLAFQFIAVRDS